MLKHAAEVVRTRTVPTESTDHWIGRIAAAEEEVREVLLEEKEEKAIRVAEMEANKASNIMAHRDEIMARPARSWFQTSKERLAVQEESKRSQPTSAKAAAAAEGGWDAEGDGGKASKKRLKGEKYPGEFAGEKPKVKRDRFAGMTRQRKRAIQRDEQVYRHNQRGAQTRGRATCASLPAPRTSPQSLCSPLLLL